MIVDRRSGVGIRSEGEDRERQRGVYMNENDIEAQGDDRVCVLPNDGFVGHRVGGRIKAHSGQSTK